MEGKGKGKGRKTGEGRDAYRDEGPLTKMLNTPLVRCMSARFKLMVG